MKFESVEKSTDLTLSEHRSGNVTVTTILYTFGQHRMQVWYHEGKEPSVLSPEF